MGARPQTFRCTASQMYLFVISEHSVSGSSPLQHYNVILEVIHQIAVGIGTGFKVVLL